MQGLRADVDAVRADVHSYRMETRAGFARLDNELDQLEKRIEALEARP
jgi:hypothetical protein